MLSWNGTAKSVSETQCSKPQWGKPSPALCLFIDQLSANVLPLSVSFRAAGDVWRCHVKVLAGEGCEQMCWRAAQGAVRTVSEHKIGSSPYFALRAAVSALVLLNRICLPIL